MPLGGMSSVFSRFPEKKYEKGKCENFQIFREKSKKMCYTESIDLDTCEEDFYVKA